MGHLLKHFYGDGRRIDLKIGPGPDVLLIVGSPAPGTTEIKTIWCGRVDDVAAARTFGESLRGEDGTIDEPISDLAVTRDPQRQNGKQLQLTLFDRRQSGAVPELTFRFRDLSER